MFGITFWGWIALTVSHGAVAVGVYLAARNSPSLRAKIDEAYAKGSSDAKALYGKVTRK